jgi:outer membrane protein OmpA-like peptidoglycan-associated protein
MPIEYTEKGKKLRAFLSHAKKISFCLLLAGGGWYGYQHGWFDAPLHQEAAVPQESSLLHHSAPANLPDQTYAQVPNASSAQVPLASSLITAPASAQKVVVNFGLIPWFANANMLKANGGARTQPGSLVDKAGVRMTMKRVDDYSVMQAGLAELAQALKNGDPNPKVGLHFAVIMSNGGPAFLDGLNKMLARLGPEYMAERVAPIGASRGEDKCMVTPEIKADPQKARGKFIAGVAMDGDQDACFAVFALNKVDVNVDESVYDQNAVNWVSTPSFVEAGRRYIANDCGAERPTLGNPSVKVKECLSGVATWLPGDKTVNDERGGLVTLVSTKEYPSLMAADVIGIRKWDNDNRAVVNNLLIAAYKAGEEIKKSDGALLEAGAVATEVFGEGSPEYWATYYKGKVEIDKTGLLENEIGGSFTYGLADALEYAGLLSGTTNQWAIWYDDRGAGMQKMYPDRLSSFPHAEEVTNYSFLKEIQGRIPTMSAPTVPVYTDAPIRQVVGNGSWQITFATGKATFTLDAVDVLNDIWKATGEARALKIAVYGHTDSIGNPAKNLVLSKKRAQAVVDWLKNKSSDLFPAGRFAEISGFGDTQPIASNLTEEGRSLNRRVQIIVGN